VKRIVVISDLQTPFENKRAVDAVAQFIDEYKPDDVISVGDESDLAPISRYALNTRSMYEGDLGKERDRVVEVLGMLKVKHITRSNHLDRWFAALARVPAFETIPEMRLEEFYKFDELGITYHQQPWSPAPGWLLMHGDEGTQSVGKTALNLAIRTNMSVVCGHTHRQALAHRTMTYLGDKKPKVVTGFEVGTLADFNSEGMRYMRFKDWQMGFGLMYVDGKHVTPVPIPINNKSFTVEGVRYSF